MDDERFCFIVEWYEDIAARTRQFQFFYFVNSQIIEMVDVKQRRMFLRTSSKENCISLSDLYIGNSINLCGRQLMIVDYGDDYTRRQLCKKKERTLAIIKPDSVNKLGAILERVSQQGFLIAKLRMCRISREQALTLYAQHQGKLFLNGLIECVTSGPLIAMEIVGENTISEWRTAIGPTDPSEARQTAPNSIRALFGTDKTYNAIHGSQDAEAAAKELEFFFSSKTPMPNTAKVGNCACCVIKPTAVKKGLAGKIISAITDAGFRIGAAQLFYLETANAEEFLEVYKGVVHEYGQMVSELISGPCIALEIQGHPDDTAPVAPRFRELAGPADPEIARHLRPRTLRAMYGQDKMKNAVHCTDLPDDGQLEVEYFFRILDR